MSFIIFEYDALYPTHYLCLTFYRLKQEDGGIVLEQEYRFDIGIPYIVIIFNFIRTVFTDLDTFHIT